MRVLLDTVVVSEWVKAKPDPHAVAWLAALDEDHAFISAVTLGELRYGVDLMSAGRRRERLLAWLAGPLPARFAGRILPFDRAAGERWGALMARGRRAGATPAVIDAMLAATALAHDCAIATRNRRDFVRLGVEIVDPWAAS